jgi:hypothetical protein
VCLTACGGLRGHNSHTGNLSSRRSSSWVCMFRSRAVRPASPWTSSTRASTSLSSCSWNGRRPVQPRLRPRDAHMSAQLSRMA